MRLVFQGARKPIGEQHQHVHVGVGEQFSSAIAANGHQGQALTQVTLRPQSTQGLIGQLGQLL